MRKPKMKAPRTRQRRRHRSPAATRTPTRLMKSGSSSSARSRSTRRRAKYSGDGPDDGGNFSGLGEHPAADAGVVQEPVDALVTSHRDVSDGIDPQPRRLAPADATVEQIDLRRDFGEDRIERFVEQFEAGKFRIARSTTTLVR
jgi:hypothetical protein